MTIRTKLIIGALALATLLPGLSVMTSTDAAAQMVGVSAWNAAGPAFRYNSAKWALRDRLFGPNRVYAKFRHNIGPSRMSSGGGAGAAMRAIMRGRH